MTSTFFIKDGDVVLDNRGQPKLVADGPKLAQDLRECFAIETQTNGFGAGLESMIGLLGDEFSLRAELGRKVNASMENLKALQNRTHKAARPPQERIARVKSVRVSSVADKKTTALFHVSVSTASNEVVSAGGALGGG